MEVQIEENAQVRFGPEIPEQFLEKCFFRDVLNQKEETISKGNILFCKETFQERFEGKNRKNLQSSGTEGPLRKTPARSRTQDP